MTYATVRLDGRDIPLIGIPKEAGEEECDACHQRFKLQDVTFALGKFWCQGCLEVIRAKLIAGRGEPRT